MSQVPARTDTVVLSQNPRVGALHAIAGIMPVRSEWWCVFCVLCERARARAFEHRLYLLYLYITEQPLCVLSASTAVSFIFTGVYKTNLRIIEKRFYNTA
jgi:hypothetical protein